MNLLSSTEFLEISGDSVEFGRIGEIREISGKVRGTQTLSAENSLINLVSFRSLAN